jgi:AcrR family transcriptional regulator
MVRKYDSSRRTEAAAKTRDAILAAAFKLHGEGILDLESLAEEANVSLATVRKHFPTRELLYEGCTDYGLHLVPLPDIEAIVAIEDAVDRTRFAVQQMFGVYGKLGGHIWSAYQQEENSPALARVTQATESMVREIAQLVVRSWPLGPNESEALAFVVAMLSSLTYRALCVQGGLSLDHARESVEFSLISYMTSMDSPLRKEAVYVPASS